MYNKIVNSKKAEGNAYRGQSYYFGVDYILFDINHDGIKECIIGEVGGIDTTFFVYTIKNGNAVYCGNSDDLNYGSNYYPSYTNVAYYDSRDFYFLANGNTQSLFRLSLNGTRLVASKDVNLSGNSLNVRGKSRWQVPNSKIKLL